MTNHPQRPPLDKRMAGDHDESIEVHLTRAKTTVDAILKTQESLQRRLDESLLSFRTEMNGAIEGLRTEMHASIEGLRAEMYRAMAELRADMRELRMEINTQMRWLIGICATNTLALIVMIVRSGNFL